MPTQTITRTHIHARTYCNVYKGARFTRGYRTVLSVFRQSYTRIMWIHRPGAAFHIWEYRNKCMLIKIINWGNYTMHCNFKKALDTVLIPDLLGFLSRRLMIYKTHWILYFIYFFFFWYMQVSGRWYSWQDIGIKVKLKVQGESILHNTPNWSYYVCIAGKMERTDGAGCT